MTMTAVQSTAQAVVERHLCNYLPPPPPSIHAEAPPPVRACLVVLAAHLTHGITCIVRSEADCMASENPGVGVCMRMTENRSLLGVSSVTRRHGPTCHGHTAKHVCCASLRVPCACGHEIRSCGSHYVLVAARCAVCGTRLAAGPPSTYTGRSPTEAGCAVGTAFLRD